MPKERKAKLNDVNGADDSDRRNNIDRRQFAYTFYLPERRDGADRRGDRDRRKTSRHAKRK